MGRHAPPSSTRITSHALYQGFHLRALCLVCPSAVPSPSRLPLGPILCPALGPGRRVDALQATSAGLVPCPRAGFAHSGAGGEGSGFPLRQPTVHFWPQSLACSHHFWHPAPGQQPPAGPLLSQGPCNSPPFEPRGGKLPASACPADFSVPSGPLTPALAVVHSAFTQPFLTGPSNDLCFPMRLSGAVSITTN